MSNTAAAYARMVHDGIVLGEMELIREAIALLRHALHPAPQDLSAILREWNRGEMESELLSLCLQANAEESRTLPAGPAAEAAYRIIASALELQVPVTVIAEAVFASSLSALAPQHAEAASLLRGPLGQAATAHPTDFIEIVRRALFCSRIVCYAQAFTLLQKAAKKHSWPIAIHEIAQGWQGGSLRSALLQRMHEAPAGEAEWLTLFADTLSGYQASWRKAVVKAVALGLPVPALTSALAFYDGYRRSCADATS